MRGWLATNPTGIPPRRAKRGDQLPGPARPELPELAVVAQRPDHVPGVVGGRLAVRDDGAQLGRGAQHGIADRGRRRELVGVGRQVLEELGHGSVHVVGLHGAQPAGRGVDGGAAQLADPDLNAR